MEQVSDKILRKIIESGGEQAQIMARLRSLSGLLSADFSAVLSKHYQTKAAATLVSCKCHTAKTMVEAADDDTSTYHYKADDDTDIFLLLDDKAIISAAAWALEGKICSESESEAKVSAIDRRLACDFAAGLITALNEEAAFVCVEHEMERLDIRDAGNFLAVMKFEAKTTDDVSLGTFTLAAPEALLPTSLDENEEKPGNEKEGWRKELLRLSADISIEVRAVLTREVVDYRVLSELYIGQTLQLNGATIESVIMEPLQPFGETRLAYGSIGARDGVRAVKLSALDI